MSIQLKGNDNSSFSDDVEIGSGTFADSVDVGLNFSTAADLYIGGDESKFGCLVNQYGTLLLGRVNDTALFINQKGSATAANAVRILRNGVDGINFSSTGEATFGGGNITLDPGTARGVNRLSIFAGSTPQIFSPNNATINILSNSNGSKGVTLPFNATSFSPIGSHSSYKDIVGSVDEEQCWSLIRDIKLKRYYYKDQPQKERSAAVSYVGPMADWLGAQDPELTMTAEVAAGDKQTYNQGLLEMKALQALSTALTRIEALEAEVQSLKGGQP